LGQKSFEFSAWPFTVNTTNGHLVNGSKGIEGRRREIEIFETNLPIVKLVGETVSLPF
jgi:hypothetical protein